MLTLLTKIFPFNTIQVIGVFLKEEIVSYSVLVMQKKGTKVNVKSIEKFNDFDRLIEHINAKIPICLVIDGKGILNKKIDDNNENDVLWSKNLDYKSIHHSTLKTSNHSLISFCRKQMAEEIIQKFEEQKLPIIDFFIGTIQVNCISNVIQKDEILANETVFKFEMGEINEMFKQKESSTSFFNIGEQTISSEDIAYYAAGICFFINDDKISRSKSDTIKQDELIYKKAFNSIGAFGLIFFFLTLLCSYLITNYLNTKNAELNLENVYSNQSYQLVLDLEKKRENKLKILNETGSFNAKYHSYYVSEIINSLPNEIILSRLTIAPLQSEIKVNKRVVFNHKEILINGSFLKESIFNFWINELKKSQWIKSLEIMQIKKNKKNVLQFELKINV